MNNSVLFNSDSLDELKNLEDNSIDAVVTDPPYGLSFMNKKWDYDVPSVALWREVLRVLKPGGHLLSFGGTRTYHRMVVNIEDAGFEIRDQIQWIYGSGFPKSHNLKDDWQGWGTALKPANEPIVLARKPLEKGLTVAENVLKYGTGALNIDECRISTNGEKLNSHGNKGDSFSQSYKANGTKPQALPSHEGHAQGRWPANILFDETAAEMLDAQSGYLHASGNKKKGTAKKETSMFGIGQNGYGQSTDYADSGGASRFFYVAKASKRERNAGLDDFPLVESGIKNDSGRGFSESDPHKKILNQNHHPTVKPIKLMEYLCKLITPPGGTILDPFMGSGSTGVAAKNLNFKFVGIEREKEYCEIAEKRIANAYF